MKDVSASRAPLYPRRRILKGAVVGVAAGAALSATTILPTDIVSAHAKYTSKKDIINIAVTAEQLAVTFYSNAVANAGALGLGSDAINYLEAALVEEQIHEQFFEALGGRPLASTFSFPNGAATFTDLSLLIQTQQQLEGAFDATFLAGVRELADQGQSRLAQILAQIAVVEGEHRVLGRVIGGLFPANDRAYAPVLIARFSDAPGVITQAGYLSPVPGNSYSYVPVSTNIPGINYRTPFSLSY